MKHLPTISWLSIFGLILLQASLANANQPTIASMQERLDAEVATLDAELEERLKALRQQYLGALDRRLDELGNSAQAAELRKERDRVAGDGRLAPGMASSDAEVGRFHKILLEQISVAEKPRNDRLEVLLNNLETFANQQSMQLRRQGQAPAAEEWQKWAKGLPVKYLAGLSSGGKSRFMTLLEAGETPYLMLIGTSTSEHTGARIEAPWQQCASGNRTDWPPVLAQELQKLGQLRLGGSTCAGVPSTDFMSQNRLRWVINQNPDAVIIEFAPGTDAVNRFNVTVEKSRAAHEEMIRQLRENNPNIEIFLWNGARSFNQGRRNYWDDRNGSDRPDSNEPQPAYAQMYRDLARDAGPGVEVIDTFAIFEDLYKRGENTYRTYFRDGNHLNRRGGEEIVVPEILRVLGAGS